MKKGTEKALKWITDLLNEKQIFFQVAGGFAAKLYGSQRPLNDIDIDIPDADFPKIIEEVKPYIVYGPVRHKDKKWDCLIITLDFEGQEIDISGADSIKIHNDRTGEWVISPTNFSKSVKMEVFGITVPVISPQDLTDYKRMLDGDHQKEDIKAVEEWINKNNS